MSHKGLENFNGHFTSVRLYVSLSVSSDDKEGKHLIIMNFVAHMCIYNVKRVFFNLTSFLPALQVNRSKKWSKITLNTKTLSPVIIYQHEDSIIIMVGTSINSVSLEESFKSWIISPVSGINCQKVAEND